MVGDTELRRTLLSLASGKKRVLKKLPPGREVKDDDKFTINEQFRDPLHTVHINSIQVKETVYLVPDILDCSNYLFRPKSPSVLNKLSKATANMSSTQRLCAS